MIPNVDTVYIETTHTLTGDEVGVQRVPLHFLKFEQNPLSVESKSLTSIFSILLFQHLVECNSTCAVVQTCLDDDHSLPNPHLVGVDSRSHPVHNGLFN